MHTILPTLTLFSWFLIGQAFWFWMSHEDFQFKGVTIYDLLMCLVCMAVGPIALFLVAALYILIRCTKSLGRYVPFSLSTQVVKPTV